MIQMTDFWELDFVFFVHFLQKKNIVGEENRTMQLQTV